MEKYVRVIITLESNYDHESVLEVCNGFKESILIDDYRTIRFDGRQERLCELFRALRGVVRSKDVTVL